MIQAAELAGLRKRAIAKPRTRSKTRYTRELLMPLLSVGLVACLGLGLVMGQAFVAYKGYRIVDLKAELTEVQSEGQRLELEIARLGSLERIEREAVERLGMCASQEVRKVAVRARVPEPVHDEPREDFWATVAAAILEGAGMAEAGSR